MTVEQRSDPRRAVLKGLCQFGMVLFGRFSRRALAAGLVALVAAGCETADEAPAYVERPVGELYNEAMDALEDGDQKKAAGLFEEVERQHPYSPWATKSQLMAAYAYYEANEYEDATAALDRFVRLHPANPDVPYALYLKGLCSYEQISDVTRDQRMSRDALADFQALVKRYPASPYARDARLKIDLINDHLAGKEMEVGRFYQRTGHHLAAINRFLIVVESFQTTTHTPEALHRLVESYTALGLVDEAQKTAAVLGYNFPGSEWYSDSYEILQTAPGPKRAENWYQFW